MKPQKTAAFAITPDHKAEYAIIRKDLYMVLALNAFYLALILVLYFTNKSSHYLEHIGARLVHF